MEARGGVVWAGSSAERLESTSAARAGGPSAKMSGAIGERSSQALGECLLSPARLVFSVSYTLSTSVDWAWLVSPPGVYHLHSLNQITTQPRRSLHSVLCRLSQGTLHGPALDKHSQSDRHPHFDLSPIPLVTSLSSSLDCDGQLVVYVSGPSGAGRLRARPPRL